MNHYAAAGLLTFLTSVVVGLIVYFKQPRKAVNRLFILFSFAVATYGYGFYKQALAASEAQEIIAVRILLCGTIFIPILFLHFVYIILGKTLSKKVLIFSYLLGGLFGLINLSTNLLARDPIPKLGFHYLFQAGMLYPLLALGFGICVVVSLLQLFQGYQTAAGLKRNQLKYLFCATLIGFSGGSAGFALGYNINLYPLNPFGAYCVPIYTIILAYAIVKYRLMDINIVIGKGIVYSILVLAISCCYILVVFVADLVFGRTFDYQNLLGNFFMFILLVSLMIYVIPRLKSKAERVIEKAIFKDKYSYRDILRDFGKRASFIAKEKICSETVRSVANALDLKTAAIFVRGEMGEGYYIKATVGLPEDLERSFIREEENPFVEYLRSCKGALILEELKRKAQPKKFSEIKKELERLEASLVIPINVENVLLGFLTLGERQAGEIFSHLDMTLLETLCAQVGLALRYRQMDQRIGEADKLISLGTLAAGLAHEIRNPLVSIQTFAELLNERYDDKNFREEFGSIVMRDVKRITGIIESIMAFAGRQPAPQAPVKIEEVIDASYSMLKTEFDRAEVTFDKKYNRVPPVLGSYNQLMQLFVNLLLNAIQALNGQCGGRVEVSTGLSKRKNMPDLVTVSVTDNGPGVDRHFLPKLFEPFVTTKAMGSDRSKRGIGLGLAIVKKIVDSHNGSITVSSEKGKGTTFIVGLPVAGGES